MVLSVIDFPCVVGHISKTSFQQDEFCDTENRLARERTAFPSKRRRSGLPIEPEPLQPRVITYSTEELVCVDHIAAHCHLSGKILENSVTKDVISGSIDQWHREDPALRLDGLQCLMWLTRAARLQEQRFAALCKQEFKLLPSEVRLLLALRRSGRPYALRPTDLFRAQLVSSGGMTKQIDSLCAAKLVLRNRDPLHAGGFLVQLTALGLKSVDRMMNTLLKPGSMSSLVEKELQHWNESEVKVIQEFMDRFLFILETGTPTAHAEERP
ncbi:MarR family winged helix-turn-helix transcriptional regulator [Hydrogenophaga sp. BPS33]|uniref:MarR family winged helix-turn-helix transcriptional regulator n=1 Tax=Hydrogenophaga sp. BPS33 TaxID=2651974 RepID=UPI00131F6A78|nr:MarR family winged helix-turn-helix transcriptional regulator [Hydrogenophaga sp. BPS33]QHE85499.1 winged helix-turn-helix transcriptional regulator [Hydrogenophaga sp. BPS33]